jgi:hypothetical protein
MEMEYGMSLNGVGDCNLTAETSIITLNMHQFEL